MKLIILLTIVATLQTTAAVIGQKITLSQKDAPLETIFKEIERQSGYDFLYNSAWLQQASHVTLDVKDAPLENVLDLCFKSQTSLTYRIVNKTIVLDKKQSPKPNLADPPKSTFDVKGSVRADNGTPLAGATVLIRRLNKSGATDAQGEFILRDVPNGKYSVEVSYIGYEKYVTEISVENHEVRIVVDMKTSSNSLDETVVKGYYNTTKKLNTGNVATVKGEDIAKQPVTDPLAALEGRVAGLYISQTNSALPGGQLVVQLRGQNSISNGNNPFYIVDGVPFTSTTLTSINGGAVVSISPFNSLSPADIESIEVLKDADATAIYGSRGANGVILITTKKGKSGKTKVDINFASGFSKPTRLMKLLNTQRYLQMRHEAFANDSLSFGATDYDINGVWDSTRNTNWQKSLFDNPAEFINGQLALSGGNFNTQFVISSVYSKQGTILPGKFSDQKGSAHISITHFSIDRKFNALISVNYVNDNSNLPLSDLARYTLLAPDAPSLFDKNGNLNWQTIGGNATWTNPLALLQRKAKAITDNLIGNASLSYKILPGFQLRTSLGYNYIQMSQLNTTPLTSFAPQNSSQTYLRETDYATNNIRTWIIEPQLSYNKQFGKGQLDVIVGSTFQQNVQNSFKASGSNYTTDALLGNIDAAASISNVRNSYSLYHYNAIYGRIGYNWEEKYILNLTARRDGSSRFGPSNQFGNFGAIGVGWIFSKEKEFANSLPFISFGKIRGSYGSTGNDQIADYQFLSSYTPYYFSYQNISGLVPSQLANLNYGWEVDKKFEGALELGFLNDKIFVTTSYFNNRSGNQLVGYPLPDVTGFSSIVANLPAVVQNTGLEFTVNTVNVRKKNFSWTTSLNLTISRNKLISFPNLSSSSYANQYIVGQSLFIRKLFYNTGVDPSSGLYTFKDVNKDGNISSPQDNTNIVQLTQKYFGGLDNSLNYKGVQLDVFFQFVKQVGHSYLNQFSLPGFFAGGFSNQPSFVYNNRWDNIGDHRDIQRLSANPASMASSEYYNYFVQSDKSYTDASFIRLKNISLSYKLPEEWENKVHLQSANIYIQCQNLFTITKYKGLDPENQGFIPPTKTITIGISLTL